MASDPGSSPDKKRRKLIYVNVTNTDFLQQLVTDSLACASSEGNNLGTNEGLPLPMETISAMPIPNEISASSGSNNLGTNVGLPLPMETISPMPLPNEVIANSKGNDLDTVPAVDDDDEEAELSDFVSNPMLSGDELSDDELLDFDGQDIEDPDYNPESDEDSSSDEDLPVASKQFCVYRPSNTVIQDRGAESDGDVEVVGDAGGGGDNGGSGEAGGNGDIDGNGEAGGSGGVGGGGDSVGSGVPGGNGGQRGSTSCVWQKDSDVTLPVVVNFPDYNIGATVTAIIENPTPVNIFGHFLDDEFWDYIVQETNRYAIQSVTSGEPPKDKSRIKAWLPTTANEMKKFVGVIICMGLCPLPEIDLYWSKNKLYENQLIKKAMTRDRFLLLRRFWHFSDNSDNEIVRDRLHKIRIIVEYLNSAYMSTLTPGKDLVIDETMVPWRGRLVFRQYIKNKSHKYGIKLYKLCTPDGYTLRMSVYSGKKLTTPSIHGHTYDVVMELMGDLEVENAHCDGYLNKGRTLYTDNFYTGIPIAEKLFQCRTHMCGTLDKKRRGIPQEVKQKLKKGEVQGYKCQHGTSIIQWKDKRNVLMLSTVQEHKGTLVETGKLDRKNQMIMKPQCVLDYNAAKKGVDYSDQMSSYYTSLRKTLKWYTKLALEMITGTTMVNSFVLHKSLSGQNMKLRLFRETIARNLMDIESDLSLSTSPFRKKPHALQKTMGDGKKKRRRCKKCYEKNRETMTSKDADKKTKQVNTFCSECPDQPFLCLDCFNKCHM